MQLPQLLQQFGITAKQLETLLLEHGIEPKLRYRKLVPDEWWALLVTEFGEPQNPLEFVLNGDELKAEQQDACVSLSSVFQQHALFEQPVIKAEVMLPGLKVVGHVEMVELAKQQAQNERLATKNHHGAGRSGGTGGKKEKPRPEDLELKLGQVMRVVEDRGFGFLQPIGTRNELFWHVSGLEKMPAIGDWLLYAERPNPKKAGKEEVWWARPVAQDESLLLRIAGLLNESALMKLLEVAPEAARGQILQDKLRQLPPLTGPEAFDAAVAALNLVRQKLPSQLEPETWALIAQAEPAYAGQLWLRYCSPLAASGIIAGRLAKLLETTPEGVASWWPDVETSGLMGLCLAYVQHGGPEVATEALTRLRLALGSEQALLYDATLVQWLKEESARTADEYRRNRAATRTAYSQETAETLAQMLADEIPAAIAFELWSTGEDLPFPQDEALAQFANLPTAVQDRVAEALTEPAFYSILPHLGEHHEPRTLSRARKTIEDYLIKQLAVISLDLESDREHIHELAWGKSGDWHSGNGADEVKLVFGELTNYLTGGEPALVVGHNIIAFDAPLLAERGLTIAENQLWDTLLVEMALSPHFHTFALQTAHEAQGDAELALRLFLTQLLRLMQLDESAWLAVATLFSSPLQAHLREFRALNWVLWLQTQDLEQEMRACFRPQPQASTLRQEVHAWLESEKSAGVVLAPREVWAEVLVRSSVRFWADEETALDYRELDEEALLQLLVVLPTELLLVQQFFTYCRQQGWPPLAANMAPAVRARLRQHEIDLGSCLISLPADSTKRHFPLCLTVEQLRDARTWLHQVPALSVLVVEPDLITLGHKYEVAQLTADELRNSPATDTEWIKFSGGQSFMGLTLKQANLLVGKLPGGYDTFWLEKHQYGQYRVWASFGWEKLLKELTKQGTSLEYRRGTQRAYPAGQLRSAVANQQRLQQRLGVVALNPETIYRSRYWLLQAELVRRIGSQTSAPVVLLVQRPEEVERLESYFRLNLKCYIPKREAQLGRRLELLHRPGTSQRLLIAPVGQAAAIFEANYLGPLQVVLESFNLMENFYLAQNTTLFEAARLAAGELARPSDNEESGGTAEAMGGVESEEDAQMGILERNLLFLLELQRPVVYRMRALIADNHEASRLWLLDPRLADFAGLERSWQLSRETVDVAWETKEAYEAAAKPADAALGGVRPEADFGLNLDEARELLRQVFLRSVDTDGHEMVHQWRENQIPYLNEILQAQTDLLVTLATGGGKSVLFQAPALYRSAYTNRLSIVVTPLKALMEDQVAKLWELGFYSSVEYINSDKQDEVQQIYRRIAGGEIALLFITPERFRSGGFSRAFWQRFTNDHGLEYAVFDEAHCISQWGHEFRPDYLHSAKVVQGFRQEGVRDFGRQFPVLLFSATVTQKIFDNFKQLFPEHEATR
ncbi:DEAD/DEAH box helicase [Hymenobacter swuensis]|uniref:DNA 3'-5' helicase n=1 Tax=Hymenobacter swuensis DY53 TaxID=1227739 RepID=W8EYW2_9BACT|nr:DEAD/DEAH box helicase [Hymenobacter swuensis]AHJ95526.1 hypothetical protein Hsw_PA0193 [Hymenobacter swuensis DY53]